MAPVDQIIHTPLFAASAFGVLALIVIGTARAAVAIIEHLLGWRDHKRE